MECYINELWVILLTQVTTCINSTTQILLQIWETKSSSNMSTKTKIQACQHFGSNSGLLVPKKNPPHTQIINQGTFNTTFHQAIRQILRTWIHIVLVNHIIIIITMKKKNNKVLYWFLLCIVIYKRSTL